MAKPGRIDFVDLIYDVTATFPDDEKFGIVSQLRRAAGSIPSNIAEGHAKNTAQFRNHLSIAMGSVAELETQLLLAGELYEQTAEGAQDLLARLDCLNRQIRTLLQRLRG